jgi:chaperonin GroEL (HSP60 family)
MIALFVLQSINILKAHGKSIKESYLLNGYALNSGRAAQGMPTRVTPARIACLDFNLQKTKMQMGVQVLVSDPRELEKIRQRYAHSSLLQFITILISVISRRICNECATLCCVFLISCDGPSCLLPLQSIYFLFNGLQ